MLKNVALYGKINERMVYYKKVLYMQMKKICGNDKRGRIGTSEAHLQ